MVTNQLVSNLTAGGSLPDQPNQQFLKTIVVSNPDNYTVTNASLTLAAAGTQASLAPQQHAVVNLGALSPAARQNVVIDCVTNSQFNYQSLYQQWQTLISHLSHLFGGTLPAVLTWPSFLDRTLVISVSFQGQVNPNLVENV